MEGNRSPPVSAQGGAKPKFSVRRPRFSAGAKPRGLRPYAGDLVLLLFLIVASYFCLSHLSSWEESITGIICKIGFTTDTAGKTIKTAQITIILFLTITSLAFLRAFFTFIAPNAPPKPSQSLKPKPNNNSESNKKPPKSKQIYEPLVPIRKPLFTQTPPRVRSDQFTSSAEKKSSFSPLSPSRTSPVPSWSSLRSSSGKRIQSEETLQKFLEETDAKIDRIWDSPVSSSSKRTAGVSPAGTPLSGTGKGRPVRMSPSSVSPSKKGDGDLIPPMSMERINEGFRNLGVYPQIEQWRDVLRQWFSSVLINPLLQKINTSHIQVMQAASNVGYSIKVSQVGSEVSLSSPIQSSPVTGWQPIVTLDEDELLYKLQSSLLQTLNKPPPQQTFGNLQQTQQNNPPNQFIQTCLDAVTEHQRLKSLMKGDLIKNLLPQIIINPNYTVTRIQDLAEGTCLKKYNYMGTAYNSSSERKWTGDLPSDSHLLLYFFSAFLEHPGWTLRNDMQWFSGSESNENPLFLGILPPKERFPEKYVAVIVGPPPVLHPGALVLSVGKQNPPGFCLYWDKKLQFSLQGRTAFWDAILLMCYKINEDYDGVVRGVHLGSPALNLLPVFDSDSET
ncbi:hypothetical protein LUZ60_013048 [Juncus effusus]|nr:hypothetical protein LUZ60_013048 [Juncus effusus]